MPIAVTMRPQRVRCFGGSIMRGLPCLLSLVLAVTLLGQGPSPMKTTMPTFKVVNGPGKLFPAILPLPEEDVARFKYILKEYFVSGIAQGQPYTTRILV